jgi:hypothetical protein
MAGKPSPLNGAAQSVTEKASAAKKRKEMDDMNEALQKAMREILMDRYGIDIDRAKCHFSTQNYAFVFPGEPFMIRVSATPKKTRSEIFLAAGKE